MKILFITTKYPRTESESYLTSELANAWQAIGHEVDVICLQWEERVDEVTPFKQFDSGVKVYFFKPCNVTFLGIRCERILRWAVSSLFAVTKLSRQLTKTKYDFVYVTAPLTPLAMIVRRFVSPKSKCYLYITDFFPIAHRDYGLIPKGIFFRVTKWLENALMKRFDSIGCMSENNLNFLREHYNIRPEQNLFVNHIWGPGPVQDKGDRIAIGDFYGLSTDKRLVLFGGQLSEGRGVEEVIDAAKLAAKLGESVQFIVIGDGRLAPQVRQAASECPETLVYLMPIPRKQYLELASVCDLGLVVTVANTIVPTFPSRTIDYVRVGLPIVASVEATTDFGQFVVDHGIGVSTLAGDPMRLLVAITDFLASEEELLSAKKAGKVVCESVFEVGIAAKRILDQSFR
jgi:glycosyltransferase involved in cell wall biosynthesis